MRSYSIPIREALNSWLPCSPVDGAHQMTIQAFQGALYGGRFVRRQRSGKGRGASPCTDAFRTGRAEMRAQSGEAGAMPYGHLTKYQLSARVRALRAEHRHLAGRAGSLPRLREIRGELTKLLAAQSSQRAVALLSRALAAEGAPISTDPSPELPPVETSNGRISVH
jgi:hypothetical protein